LSLEIIKNINNSKNDYEKSKSSSEVKFGWNKQSIKWYLESEKNTTFYKKILEELNPFIKDSRTILDIGCGLGSFSIELAKKGYNVTAIDKSPLAIEAFLEKAKLMNLTNMEILNSSYEEFPFDNNYDTVFISYMMGLVNENNITDIMKKVNKRLIVVLPFRKIKNDFSINELYAEIGIDLKSLEQFNYIDIINILNKRNKKYILKKVTAEFGQPFENIDEAVNFIYHYFKLPVWKSNDIKSWLSKKLVYKNGMLYLPNQRESMIIIV